MLEGSIIQMPSIRKVRPFIFELTKKMLTSLHLAVQQILTATSSDPPPKRMFFCEMVSLSHVWLILVIRGEKIKDSECIQSHGEND